MARPKIASRIGPGTCRLVTALLVGLSCVLLVSVSAMLALLVGFAFDSELSPQLRKTTSIIAHSASERVSHALLLDIPLEQLEGMDGFFDRLAAKSPGGAYFALTSLDGQLLHRSSGKNSVPDANATYISVPLEELSVATAQDTTRPGSATFAGTIDGFYHMTIPVIKNGQAVAGFHVGVPSSFLYEKLFQLAPDFLTVMFVAIFVMCELLVFSLVIRTAGRLELLHSSVERVAHSGDFNNAFRSKVRDEIGRFARIFNQIIARLNERYSNLRQDAREVRAAQISSSTIENIDEIMKHLRKSFSFGSVTQNLQHQRETQFVRLPLLLFLFAEEMSRAFLPLYAHDLYQLGTIGGLFGVPVGAGLAVALPIMAFMLTVMIVTPLASIWQDKLPIRSLFLVGLVPALAGYIGTVFASDLTELIAWRCLSALGYALIYRACQGFLLRRRESEPTGKSRGLGEFSSAFFVAAVTAPAVGAILAEQIGYQNVFWLSGALIATSAWLIYATLLNDKLPERKQRTTWRKFFSALKVFFSDRRLCSMVLLTALPQRMFITGVWFYMMPLYLFHLGHAESRIGQVFLCFGVATFLFYFLFSKLIPSLDRSDGRLSSRAVLVCAGNLLIGAGGILIFLAASDLLMILLAVSLLGFGRALSIAPQFDLTLELAAAHKSAPSLSATLAVTHTIERLGSVAGPIVALAFLAVGTTGSVSISEIMTLGAASGSSIVPEAMAYASAIAAMGVVMVIGALLFAAVGLVGSKRRSPKVAPTLKKKPAASRGVIASPEVAT